MKTQKKKILVLSELKKDLDSTIKSAASLAKIMNADVDFFYVKKPTEIVKKESQLSAIRSINREQIETEKQLQNLLDPYKIKYNMKINPKFSFGNVKNEIEKYINKVNPDIIVLGKRKTGPFGLSGNKVTKFVLNSFSGPVLIAPTNNVVEPQDDISIGVLNKMSDSNSETILDELINLSKNSPKTFKIVNKAEEVPSEKNAPQNEYVFEKNDNSINVLSNYLEKSRVNLLYVDRVSQKNRQSQESSLPVKSIIDKINVPLLFGDVSKFGLN